MRGRLLMPFMAEIARLDTAATQATGGYDPIWRTVKTSYPGGIRMTGRVESEPIRLRCQVEVGKHGDLHEGPSGNAPTSRFVLVFHFRDLEQASLTDPETGDPLLKVNDRLVAIYDKWGNLTQTFPDPPGLYAIEVQPREYGLGLRRNLLQVTFEDNPQAVR